MLLFILNPAQGSSNDSGRGIFEALENDQFSKYLLFVVNLFTLGIYYTDIKIL